MSDDAPLCVRSRLPSPGPATALMTSAFASPLEALCPSFWEIFFEGQEALLRLHAIKPPTNKRKEALSFPMHCATRKKTKADAYETHSHTNICKERSMNNVYQIKFISSHPQSSFCQLSPSAEETLGGGALVLTPPGLASVTVVGDALGQTRLFGTAVAKGTHLFPLPFQSFQHGPKL